METKRIYAIGVYWYGDIFGINTGTPGFSVDIPTYFRDLYGIRANMWLDL